MSNDYTPPPPPPSSPSPISGGGGELVYPTNPPKDPILILLLNLFLFGGVGSIILGQKTKGIVYIIVSLIIAIPTCGTGSLAIGALGAVDGYLQAQQLKAGHPVGQWTFFNDHR
jgi:TM2 domain-containing membrane protein YozV